MVFVMASASMKPMTAMIMPGPMSWKIASRFAAAETTACMSVPSCEIIGRMYCQNGTSKEGSPAGISPIVFTPY